MTKPWSKEYPPCIYNAFVQCEARERLCCADRVCPDKRCGWNRNEQRNRKRAIKKKEHLSGKRFYYEKD